MQEPLALEALADEICMMMSKDYYCSDEDGSMSMVAVSDFENPLSNAGSIAQGSRKSNKDDSEPHVSLKSSLLCSESDNSSEDSLRPSFGGNIDVAYASKSGEEESKG